MKVTFDNIITGAEYERPKLASMWGYSGYQALAKGIVTPSRTPYIILFVTEEKQAFQTQYKDCLANNILMIDGETAHTSDQRIVHAKVSGAEIHLFHRFRHHSPFVYYGKLRLTGYTLNTSKPSRFIFSVGENPTVIEEFDHSFTRRQTSYKMVTILALLSAGSDYGYAAVDNVAMRFAAFYRERSKRGIAIEKTGIAMDKVDDMDIQKIRQVLLNNPVVYLGEFLEHNKKMNTLAFKDEIWSTLDDELMNILRRIAYSHLRDYYRDLDGLGFTEAELSSFFKEVSVYGADLDLQITMRHNKKFESKETLSVSNENCNSDKSEGVVIPPSASAEANKRNLHQAFKTFFKDHEKIAEVTDLQFLGQYEFTEEDVDRLGEQIYAFLKEDLYKGFDFIRKESPETLAFYLVGKGVYCYEDGDYWSAVADSIGLHDVNWQSRFGQWFVDYLETTGKKILELPDAHKFVANILLHGGIPQSCLPSYFEEIIKLCMNEDLIRPDYIRTKLADWRHQEKMFWDIDRQIVECQAEHANFLIQVEHAKQLSAIKTDILRFKNSILDDKTISEKLDEDFEAIRQKRIDDLAALTVKEQSLTDLENDYRSDLDELRNKYEALISSAPVIQAFIEQYSRDKDMVDTAAKLKKEESKCLSKAIGLLEGVNDKQPEKFVTKICELPLDKLVSLIKQHAELQASFTLQKDDLYSVKLKVVKPGISLGLGLILVAVGFTLILINPLEALFWLPGIIGLLVTIYGWMGYSRTKIKAGKEQINKELIFRETEMITSRISSIQAEIEELSEGLFSSRLLSKVDFIEEMAVCLEEMAAIKKKQAAIAGDLDRLLEKAEKMSRVCLECEEFKRVDMPDPEKLDQFFKIAVGVISMFIKEPQKIAEIQAKSDAMEQKIRINCDEQKTLQSLIDATNETLASIGDGDVDLGAALVKDHYIKKARIADLENELRKTGLSLYNRNWLVFGPDDLKKLNNKLEAAFDSSGKEINKLQKRQSELARPFNGLDEPIRRFLFYGEKWSENWLLQTIHMYLSAKTGGSFKTNEESLLPARVIKAFQEWWTDEERSKSQPIVTQTPLRQRLTAPLIRLDPTGELNLIFPSQRFHHSEMNLSQGLLSVYAVEIGRLVSEINLPLYKSAAGLFETDEINICLVDITGTLKVSFSVGEIVIQKWTIRLMIEENMPVLVFDESGNLINNMPLARGKLWFLLQEDFSFCGDYIPLEEGLIYVNGDYYLQLINLNTIEDDQLYIEDRRGNKFCLILSNEKKVAPFFVGETVIGANVDGDNALYLKDNLEIHIPAYEKSELATWDLKISPNEGYSGKEILYNLERFLDVILYNQDTSTLVLPLAKMSFFAEELCGCYTFTFVMAQSREYRLNLSFVDSLDCIFTPKLSSPPDGDAGPISLTIQHTKGLVIKSLEPAEFQTVEDDNLLLTVKRSVDRLTGLLCWVNADGCAVELKLTIAVPKIRWRLQGLNESSTSTWLESVEELWFGEWQTAKNLFLFISFPNYLKGKARLALEGSSHYYEEEIKRGLVKFNLLPFSDTVRLGNELAVFTLDVYDHRRTKYILSEPLFRVRTKWVVSEFDLHQDIDKNITRLNISWNECGKLDGRKRIIRLWDKGQPFTAPAYVTTIPEGDTTIIVEKPLNELLPGYYLLEFDVEDPWSATQAETVFPQKTENAFPCEIVGNQIIVRDFQVDWLNGDAGIQGRLGNGGFGLPVEIFIYGCDRGQWLCWSKDTIADDHGYFKAVIPAQQTHAHWAGVRVKSHPPAYLYAVLPEPSGLLFPWNKELLEMILAFGSELAEIRIFDASDTGLNTPLSTVKIVDILNIINDDKKELTFRIKYSDSTSKEVIMMIDIENKIFRIKLEQGVRCTGQGCKDRGHYEIYPNQAAWFEHTSRLNSPQCKSMETNYRSSDVQLVIAWDIKPYLSQLKLLFPLLGDIKLFSNIGSQLSRLINVNPYDKDNVGEKLLKQEIAVIDKLLKCGLLDRRREYSSEY